MKSHFSWSTAIFTHFLDFFGGSKQQPVPSKQPTDPDALPPNLVGFHEVGVVALGLEDTATTCSEKQKVQQKPGDS